MRPRPKSYDVHYNVFFVACDTEPAAAAHPEAMKRCISTWQLDLVAFLHQQWDTTWLLHTTCWWRRSNKLTDSLHLISTKLIRCWRGHHMGGGRGIASTCDFSWQNWLICMSPSPGWTRASMTTDVGYSYEWEFECSRPRVMKMTVHPEKVASEKDESHVNVESVASAEAMYYLYVRCSILEQVYVWVYHFFIDSQIFRQPSFLHISASFESSFWNPACLRKLGGPKN